MKSSRMESMVSRLTLLIAVVCCVGIPAHADEASHTAKVREFFKVAKLDQLSLQIMQQAMGQVDAGMMQQMLGVKLNAEQQKSLDQLNGKLNSVLMNALGWEKLEPEYTRMYAAAFTEQEMDDILAFYKSSTGRAMIEKSPMLLTESSKIAQQRMAVAMPEIQKLVKEFMVQQNKPAP